MYRALLNTGYPSMDQSSEVEWSNDSINGLASMHAAHLTNSSLVRETVLKIAKYDTSPLNGSVHRSA